MTADDFKNWMAQAKVGETVVYYRGPYLVSEDDIRLATSKAADHGLVFLSQLRVDEREYAYRATRISRRTHEVLDNLFANLPLFLRPRTV